MSVASPKQEQFVLEYLKDLNGKQAAIRAGYSPRTAESQASRLLTNVKVQAAIQAEMDKRAKRTHIDSDYVLNTIRDTVDRCRQATQVFDRKGEPVMVQTEDGKLAAAYAFDATNVLKGCELLGKHLKLFTDKAEVKHSIGPSPEDLAKLDPKELEAYESIMTKLAGGSE